MRTIAAAAGVSPALVIHHFGSKDGLRAECDRHVAALIRSLKRGAIARGPGFDLFGELRQVADGPPLLGYLASTLAENSPETAGLVDEMVGNAIAYTAEAERAGMVVPTDDPHGRAVVLALWSLGSLVLREHVRRLLGVDLTGDISQAMRFVRPVLEVYGRGVLTEQAYAQLWPQATTDATTREDET